LHSPTNIFAKMIRRLVTRGDGRWKVLAI